MFCKHFEFCLRGGVFCESNDCYLLFIPIQLAQSDLKTFLEECLMCLHDVFKQFQENKIF